MYYNNKDRYNNIQSIQDIIEKIIDSPALSKGIRETRAIKAWNKVLGPTVANITKKIYINRGVLYVSLHSSVIRNDLIMHKDKIIHSLNTEAGAKIVYDLVIR